MKKTALILLLALCAASCAVKDKNAPGADPDYNRFFYLTQSQLHSTATTIWVESLDFSGPHAGHRRQCGRCKIWRVRPYYLDRFNPKHHLQMQGILCHIGRIGIL